jgi:hypothetical protein
MDAVPSPLAFFLLLLSGWVNRQQQAVIDYLLAIGTRFTLPPSGACSGIAA